MAVKFSSDHIKVQKKENGLPPLLNGDYRRKHYYVADANIQVLVFLTFRLLTHLGVNNIPAAFVINKNRIRKCAIIVAKQHAKKELGHLQQRTSNKKVE